MIIISYDIASKSLAVSVMRYNDKWQDELNEIHHSFNSNINCSALLLCQSALKHIDLIEKLVDNMIQPIFFDVVDLIPNKKIKETDVVLRSSRLKGYLMNIDKKIESFVDTPIKILLEYQMGPNDKSRNVCSQILYHYSNNDCNFKSANIVNDAPINNKFSIEIIGPSLKNKLNFVNGQDYNYFLQKYNKKYDANKKHSIANMIHWLNAKNSINMISKIKKTNYDDIADAITMALAWILIKK